MVKACLFLRHSTECELFSLEELFRVLLHTDALHYMAFRTAVSFAFSGFPAEHVMVNDLNV